MECDNNRKFTGVDTNKDVNISGTNVPAVEMTQNNEITGVYIEPFEHNIGEEFINDKNPDTKIPPLPQTPPPAKVVNIIPKINPQTCRNLL